MFARSYTGIIQGIEAFLVQVEADITRGLPLFHIVGLADTAIKESKERVRSAIKNIGFTFPTRRIVINLAPAGIKKEGSIFDLAIALSILAADEKIKKESLERFLFVGELALDGSLRPLNGALLYAMLAEKEGFEGLVLPSSSGAEASLIEKVRVYEAENLLQIIKFLNGQESLPIASSKIESEEEESLDFLDVKGQLHAKRAIEIAAAGFHNILMIGPPGSGKSMLAKRIPSILPPPTFQEAMEITKIYSAAGLLRKNFFNKRPFRSPHHTISDAALIGGGRTPSPGEITLAHNGVLFLDEFSLFPSNLLEALRQPLEDGKITVSRVSGQVVYPANFMLVCAMNPCPCGYLGHPEQECRCTSSQIQKYLNRISGPLIDRIDIHIEVPSLKIEEMRRKEEYGSSIMREKVKKAWEKQNERFRNHSVRFNSRMNASLIKEFCVLDDESMEILEDAFDKLALSARSYDKILKVARTVADMEGAEQIQKEHILEAIGYRVLDRRDYII